MPEHYFAAVVRRAELNAAITTAGATSAIGALERAPLRVQIRPLLQPAWNLRGHLTVHDAAWMAETLGDHARAGTA